MKKKSQQVGGSASQVRRFILFTKTRPNTCFTACWRNQRGAEDLWRISADVTYLLPLTNRHVSCIVKPVWQWSLSGSTNRANPYRSRNRDKPYCLTLSMSRTLSHYTPKAALSKIILGRGWGIAAQAALSRVSYIYIYGANRRDSISNRNLMSPCNALELSRKYLVLFVQSFGFVSPLTSELFFILRKRR